MVAPHFFERSWHDLQIHDYLKLLKVFKELGRRYFVDILLPDKQGSRFASYTNQVATYSPFRIEQTGLTYKLVFNVPIYFVDTTASANAYVASEEGIGFGRDISFNAVMFTDTSVDTVETGSIVYLYPVEVDIQMYYELYKLLANNQITEALTRYQTYFVGNSAVFEIVATNRYTLSDNLGFIWQISLKKTDKRIDFDKTNITEFLAYDAYYNSIQQIPDFLLGFWLWQLYELLEKLRVRKAYSTYPGILLPYDRYTLVDILLWLQEKLSNSPKDLGLLGITSNRYISNAYSQQYDILQNLPTDHVLRTFLATLENEQTYSPPIRYTTDIRTRFIQSHSPNYVHGYCYAIDDPFVQMFGYDAYVANLLEQVLVTNTDSTYWYTLWQALTNRNIEQVEQSVQTISKVLEPYTIEKPIEQIVAELPETFTIDFQLLQAIVLYQVAKRIKW